MPWESEPGPPFFGAPGASQSTWKTVITWLSLLRGGVVAVTVLSAQF